MKTRILILVGIIGFAGLIVPDASGMCPLLPCENSYTEDKTNFKFIDFSYTHTIGEPIQFILEKAIDRNCNSYNAKITDDDGNFVLGWGADISCDPTSISSSVSVQTKIGYNENRPIIINDSGKYYIELDFADVFIKREFAVRQNHGGASIDNINYSISREFSPPLKQFKDGITIDEIECRDSLVLVTKHNGSPACVKPETKQHLIDRNWAETQSLDEIQGSHELIKQNIVRIEDGLIALYPENMCASITLELPTTQDIQRYKNDEKGLDDTNILQITSSDLKEIPNIQELIYAVHSIEFPYNKHSSVYLDGLTFVEYEFFLMEKAMKKYGDSQEDYFIKLDTDYEERFSNPAKQGFTNHFEAPVIIYNDYVYSVSSTNFWTSDEHEPRRMGIFPINSIEDDEKFIMLSDDDMKFIPKIKDAIESVGTIKESVSAHKGLPEDQWNEYREWFEQKSQDRLYAEWFRFIQYDEQFYLVGFLIC